MRRGKYQNTAPESLQELRSWKISKTQQVEGQSNLLQMSLRRRLEWMISHSFEPSSHNPIFMSDRLIEDPKS